MKFSNYQSLLQWMKKEDGIKHTPEEFYQPSMIKNLPQHHQNRYTMEAIWYKHQRPYYNVWPVIEGMMDNVSLDIPASLLKLPEPAILLRFTESSSIEFCMVCSDELDGIGVFIKARSRPDMSQIAFKEDDQYTLQKYLDDYENKKGIKILDPNDKPIAVEKTHYGSATEVFKESRLAMKILVSICMLSGNSDFIQPVYLSKDTQKWMKANDEERQKLADKAVRRTRQKGFDLGREIEAQYSATPHIRRPHLCTFWTGKGRKTPVLKLRAGAVINPHKATEVPTGYFDKEKAS